MLLKPCVPGFTGSVLSFLSTCARAPFSRSLLVGFLRVLVAPDFALGTLDLLPLLMVTCFPSPGLPP